MVSRNEIILVGAFLLLLSIAYSGCNLVEDDRGNDCEFDCTTLKGSVLTEGGEAVAGLRLSFSYNKRGLFAGRRDIADFITDINGEYQFDFYIPDEELEESGRYYVSLDSALFDASRYILPEDPAVFYDLDRRDLTYYLDCYLPRKDYISVRVDDFIKVRGDETFSVHSSFRGGFSTLQETQGRLIGRLSRSRGLEPIDGTAFIDNVLVAQGDTTWVTLTKNKRGVERSEEIVIYKEAGEPITIERRF